MTNRFVRLMQMIRFSHTIFALPFAIMAAILAVQMPMPDGSYVRITIFHVIGIALCMVFARSAAMAFNRLVDHRIDAANPRTKSRHLPVGDLSRREVWGFLAVCCIGFIASTTLFFPNRLPLYGSVPVLAFLLLYSVTKRFTWAAHLWLGVALSFAPICVWVALRGLWPPEIAADLAPAIVIALAVATWVAGFDIIYACQDAEFDRSAGLHSVPARLGVKRSLWVAAGLHAMTLVFFAVLPVTGPGLGLGGIYVVTVLVIAALLAYQHWLVRPDDLTRVNVAFFNVNATISVLLLVATALDCLV